MCVITDTLFCLFGWYRKSHNWNRTSTSCTHAEFGLKLVTNMVQAVYVDVLKPESLLYGAIIRLERSISF